MSIQMTQKMNKPILMAIGANLPAPNSTLTQTLEEIIARLTRAPCLSGVTASALFRTPAWPEGSGPDYLNAAVVAESDATPAAVLSTLHAIEESFGRVRDGRWSARSCDLDLIGYDDAVLPDRDTVRRWIEADPLAGHVPDDLLVPHPRMHRRAFVLLPLAEVAPEWSHPVLGKTIAELAAALPEADRAACVRI